MRAGGRGRDPPDARPRRRTRRRDLAEEARGFVKLAKDIDPAHPKLVAVLEQRLQLTRRPPAAEAEPEFEFEIFDQPAEPDSAHRAGRPAAPPPAVRRPRPPAAVGPAGRRRGHAALPSPAGARRAAAAVPAVTRAPRPQRLFSFDEAAGDGGWSSTRAGDAFSAGAGRPAAGMTPRAGSRLCSTRASRRSTAATTRPRSTAGRESI